VTIKKVIQNVARAFTGQPGQYVIPTRLYHRAPVANVDTLSTGLRSLDKTLGIGGLPCGQITELIGPGKMPLSDGVHCVAAKIGANVQRKQHLVTIIDMALNFDPWQAERCGLMTPHLLLSRPDTLLAALTTLESAARNQGLVIVNMGVVPNLFDHVETDSLKTLLRRLHAIIRQSESVFLFLTHPLADNAFTHNNYPAGFPLADLADVRLWVQNESWTNKDGFATAYKASIAVIKNRLAAAGVGADIRIKLAGV
jgi:hypothetical protein